MTMNLGLRRIASLSAFLVAVGVASASQAGVIPWVYDSIFGPVRYPAYGSNYSSYPVSYSRPVYVSYSRRYVPVSYAPSSGCSSCSTGYVAPVSYYSPVTYSAPSYGCGGCGQVVAASSCGPCGGASYASATSPGGCLSGGCSPATTSEPASQPITNGKSAWNSTKKPSEVTKDPAPTPRTFQETDRGGASPAGATSTDGFGSGIRRQGSKPDQTLLNDVDENRPATNVEEPTISKPKKAPVKEPDDLFDTQPEATPAKPIKKPFEQPIENNDPDATESKTEAAKQRLRPAVNLDAKIAWQSEPPQSRVPYHAKLAKATVTRRAPGLNSDWTPVVAKPTGHQLVRK